MRIKSDSCLAPATPGRHQPLSEPGTATRPTAGGKDERCRVLMELRPAFEGFAGIPQETRLLYSMFQTLDDVEATGLINHASRWLWPGLARGLGSRFQRTDARVHTLSKFAISTKVNPHRSWMERWRDRYQGQLDLTLLLMMSWFKLPYRVTDFDARLYGDFVWQMLFSRSLPASDFERIRNGRYASIRVPWNALHKVGVIKGMRGEYPRMNTRGYDVFLSQVPWPGIVNRGTQLVVRYHDAIPVFLPHTIPEARKHQHSHFAALRSNQRRALFACTSQATREDLLSIYPALERRAVVIPDIVSHEYFEEKTTPEYLANIVQASISTNTELKFLTVREREGFYARHLRNRPLKYLLMVSTLEPRKSHMKLLGAWQHIKNTLMPDLRLIVVGTPGWDCDRIIEAMRPWQQSGDLFHLERVPSGSLRLLYSHAEAVVCPSVSEGFDLSGVEAMLSGGPVIASDIKVHREVYGKAAEYFNPYSTLDQARAIERVVMPANQRRREELISLGLRQGGFYRRDVIAPQWAEFFARVKRGEFQKTRSVLRAVLPR